MALPHDLPAGKDSAETDNALAQQSILPTLFGEGRGHYQKKPANFLISGVLHGIALAGILLLARTAVSVAPTREAVTPITLNMPVLVSSNNGGGGGGKRDILPASKGVLPKRSLQPQIVPPTVIVHNDHPKLTAEETVVAPEMKLSHDNQLGDLKGILNTASDGRGVGGGIGNGKGTGDGSGDGAGSGPGYFHVGIGGVSAPRPIYSPDPEYSEEARQAKYQGTVILWVVVGPDGRVQQARVQRHIGLGLDEKALEAVRQWKFDPALKNGRAVPVAVSVEMSFRLY